MSVIILISCAYVFQSFWVGHTRKVTKLIYFGVRGLEKINWYSLAYRNVSLFIACAGRWRILGGGGHTRSIVAIRQPKRQRFPLTKNAFANKSCNLCNHLGLGTSMVLRLSPQVYKICKCILFNYNTIPRKENVLPETLWNRLNRKILESLLF